MAKHLLILEQDWAMAELIALNAMHFGYTSSTLTGIQPWAQRQQEAPAHDVLLLGPSIPPEVACAIRRTCKQDSATGANHPFFLKWCLTDQEKALLGPDWGTEGDRSRVVVLTSMAELMAHVQAVVPLDSGVVAKHQLQARGWTLDIRSRRLSDARESVSLPPTEFRLMQTFFCHQDQVIGRPDIIAQVWGRSKVIDSRTVDVHVKRLRGHLAQLKCPPIIETVRGAGYCLRLHEHVTDVSHGSSMDDGVHRPATDAVPETAQP